MDKETDPALIANKTKFRQVFDTYFEKALIETPLLKQTTLINEVPLYELAYHVLDKIKQDYLSTYKNAKDADAIKMYCMSLKNKTINFREYITPLIKKHMPCLIIDDLPSKFDNDLLKHQISAYRIKPSDTPQDGLFNFLSILVMMYRTDLNKQPLDVFLQCLSEDAYLHKRVKARLRDGAERGSGECWASGNHEWLPCHLIKDILARSAGMHKGYESFVLQQHDNAVEIMDWLKLHRDLRTKVKSLYFLNAEQTIASGHVPAVRDKLDGHPNEGSKTEGTRAYHNQLVRSFNKNKTLRDFVRDCRHIEKAFLVRGKKRIKASTHSFFTVEGRRTDRQSSMSELRHATVKTAYRRRKALMQSLEHKTSKPGVLPRVSSFDSTNSEISDSHSLRNSQLNLNDISAGKIIDQDDLSLTETYSLASSSSSGSHSSLHSVFMHAETPIVQSSSSEYIELVESVLINTLQALEIDKETIKAISSLLIQLRNRTPTPSDLLFTEFNNLLTEEIKTSFILNLHQIYTSQFLDLQTDDPLLHLASKMSYHQIIKVWENVCVQPADTLKPRLVRLILKHAPLGDSTDEFLTRNAIQSDVLMPFFLHHTKLGDAREGDPHKHKYSQLNTVRDIRGLIEESRNSCKLYDTNKFNDSIATYFDIRSAYQALYTAISEPSKRYTHKESALCCCPCFFNSNAPLAYVSNLALKHLKLVKLSFIDRVEHLVLYCPKQKKEALISSIKQDIQLDDHFVNQYRKRHAPRWYNREHTSTRSALTRELSGHSL